MLELQGTYGEIRYAVVSRRGLHFAGDVLPTPVAFQSRTLIRRCDEFSKMASRRRPGHADQIKRLNEQVLKERLEDPEEEIH